MHMKRAGAKTKKLGLHESAPGVQMDVACDNVIGALPHPKLTTARKFPEQIGEQMAKTILNCIADPSLPSRNADIPIELIRGSSWCSFALRRETASSESFVHLIAKRLPECSIEHTFCKPLTIFPLGGNISRPPRMLMAER